MPRKASELGFAGFWCVLLLCRSFALNQINIIFFSDNRIECNRGGTRSAEKSPVQPSDLVVIHNHIMEALAKPDIEINEDYDFWNAVRNLKAPYVKFCNAFNSRIRIALAEYRIIPEDESEATTARVKGIILSWKSRTAINKQTTSEMTMELQFLEHHKKQYLELSTDFASISFMPKSRAALENMKELVLLDLRILLGADIAWSHSGKQPEAAAGSELAAPAISQGGSGDDNSESGRDDSAASEAAATQAAAPDAAEPALDPNNFLTWTHKNWNKVPFELIRFPLGQTPLKTKAYYAVAVIFLNTVSLRVQHAKVWQELTEAWVDTFGVPLSNEKLGDPPETGPNAFTEEERVWCEQTRRHFNAGGRAASPPPGDKVSQAEGRGKRVPVRRRVVAEHLAGGSPATPAPSRKATAAATPKTPTNSG